MSESSQHVCPASLRAGGRFRKRESGVELRTRMMAKMILQMSEAVKGMLG